MITKNRFILTSQMLDQHLKLAEITSVKPCCILTRNKWSVFRRNYFNLVFMVSPLIKRLTTLVFMWLVFFRLNLAMDQSQAYVAMAPWCLLFLEQVDTLQHPPLRSRLVNNVFLILVCKYNTLANGKKSYTKIHSHN